MLCFPTATDCPFTCLFEGVHSFIAVWAGHSGSLEVLATTPDDADDMAGAELQQKEKQGFIDAVPTRPEVCRMVKYSQVTMDEYRARRGCMMSLRSL